MVFNINLDIMHKISNLHDIPQGAYNIRKNGETLMQKSTEHISILTLENGKGLKINISSECQNESLHIPVIIENEDMQETVYNHITVGGGANVTIVAGCGLHNEGSGKSQHDGIHEITVGKWAKLKYVENHYASGTSESQKILNPQTTLHVGENATVNLEMNQLGGVNKTKRKTRVYLSENAKLIVGERLMTENKQFAESDIEVELNGKDSSAQIVSKSVAKDFSRQIYTFEMIGNNRSKGHIECDSIIMNQASVVSKPIVAAYNSDANLIHEAAIGRIESRQLLKLMTLGIEEKEAEEIIINGFLK